MFEKLVKRIIFVAQCDCGERDIKTENPPREKMCKCGKWVKYIQEEWIGKDKM